MRCHFTIILWCCCCLQERGRELEEKRALLEGMREVFRWKARQAALSRACAWSVVLESEGAVQASFGLSLLLTVY